LNSVNIIICMFKDNIVGYVIKVKLYIILKELVSIVLKLKVI
jgi:hypothetical protein